MANAYSITVTTLANTLLVADISFIYSVDPAESN